MEKYFSHSDYQVMIAHFPGNTKQIHKDLIDRAKQTIFTKPDNVTIVSVNTIDTLDTSPLPYQLALNNMPYINPIKDPVSWSRVNKIMYMIEAIKQVDTEYCLALDGNDVVIMSDLDDIVERYKTYNKDVIYNATIWRFPPVNVDFVEDRYKYGTYNYLNAGCVIGKTDKLLQVYEEAWEKAYYDHKNPNHDSEQYYIRKVFDVHQDWIWFDYDCRIFQCWHKAEYIEDENGDRHLTP